MFFGKIKINQISLEAFKIAGNGGGVFKKLQKIVGYLVYAAWGAPFGRPLISTSFLIDRKNVHQIVKLDAAALTACDIWLFLLKENRGLPFNYILGQLPYQKDEWFMDASKIGYGGVCGVTYFRISHNRFLASLPVEMKRLFGDAFIAYREFLAVLFAFQVFAKIAPKSFIRINSDNSSAVAWINKGRCSKKMGFLILSAIEVFKFRYGLKIKACYIESKKNRSADDLSRRRTPHWLRGRGTRVKINVLEIVQLLKNPLPFWKNEHTLF